MCSKLLLKKYCFVLISSLLNVKNSEYQEKKFTKGNVQELIIFDIQEMDMKEKSIFFLKKNYFVDMVWK